MSEEPSGYALSSAAPIRVGASVDRDTERRIGREPWAVEARRISMEWQDVGCAVAMLWEIGSGVGDGRAYELGGLVASAGEQLAMACACIVEAKLWLDCRSGLVTDNGGLVGAEMCQRSMAEAAAYNLLAVGHRLANITVRAVTLRTARRSAASVMFSKMSHDPNDYSPANWLSLEKESAKKLRRICRRTFGSDELAQPISDLAKSSAWTSLTDARARDFHRRRPQTGGIAGASMGSPWVENELSRSGTLGGPEYKDGDGLADVYLSYVMNALSAITEAMEAMSEPIERATRNQ